MNNGLPREVVARFTNEFYRQCKDRGVISDGESNQLVLAIEAAFVALAEPEPKPRRMKANSLITLLLNERAEHGVEHDKTSSCYGLMCQPVDAPLEINQQPVGNIPLDGSDLGEPEVWDTVVTRIDKKERTVEARCGHALLLSVLGDTLTGHPACFPGYTKDYRVTRKAELDIGDFVEVKASGVRGEIVGSSEYGYKLCGHGERCPRSELRLIARGNPNG